MKYLWGILIVIFAIGTIGSGMMYIDGKQNFDRLFINLLLTSFFIYLYNRSEKKTITSFIVRLYFFLGGICGGLGIFYFIKHFTHGISLQPALILFVIFGIIAVLHNKAKKKNAINDTALKHSPAQNPELQDFFEKSLEENIQSIETGFGENADENKKKQIISDKMEHIVELAYKDGIISEDEEQKITEVLAHYGMKASDLPRYTHEMLIKGLIIRDLLEGKCSDRIVVPNNTFNLMKSEKMIFAFGGMPISEIKTVSEYQAGSQGFSFRVMKGVYYHAGGTKGKRIEKKVVKSLGYSDVVITNKHVYFQANGDAMRIKHDKIVSIIPDSEGVTVFRDGARQNPLCFQTNDAWFLANVMKNAQNVG